MAKVIIIQKSLKHYRVKFYNLLKQHLNTNGIELELIYGQSSLEEAKKGDEASLEWARFIPSRIFRLGNREIYWQPVIPMLHGSDLIIIEQASKLLINYILVILNLLKIKRVAFWGHGKNFQEITASQFGEYLKKFISKHVHWWFAYNDLSAKVIKSYGFPPNRITSVQNAIDTKSLSKEFEKLSEKEVEATRCRLGINTRNIGLFIGGMYPEKRLSFLIESLKLIKEHITGFEMLFIGSGVDSNLVVTAAERYPWIHYPGPIFGLEKIPFFYLSKVLLMPGQVGLAILDSFALETPLVTTNVRLHAPEISYLEDGVNGVMVQDWNNPQTYAKAVINLLTNHKDLDKLIQGCRNSKQRYSIENMVSNFTGGIIAALDKKNERLYN